MRCECCEVALDCTDPAQRGGGCDMDGADDFGCDLEYNTEYNEEEEEESPW